MANSFQVVDWVTMEALRVLKNTLAVARCFNTDYNKDFRKPFAVGDTVRIKLPQRFTIRDGLGYNAQAINRIYTTVTCDQVFGVDFEMDSVEAALKAERGKDAIRADYIVPVMNQIAQEIDSRATLFAYQHTPNIVGLLGTNPTAMSTYNEARAELARNACPPGDKTMIISPGMQVSISSAVASVFNPTDVVSDVFRQGVLGKGAGFSKWFESMSLYDHTAGTTTTPEVDGAGQSGASLLISCVTGNTFNQGDVFQIEAVYNVNPVTRRSTGILKRFTVTQATVGAASAATLSIYPAIVGPGSQYQNVDSLPANDADLTFFPD